MSAQMLIVKHIMREGPGLFRDVMKAHQVTADVVELDRGDQIPPIGDYKAVLVLGGPQSANDKSGEIARSLQLVFDALDTNIPYLGVCLGHQLLVKAAGGTVRTCVQPEIGFVSDDGEPYRIVLTIDGMRDPIFRGLPTHFDVFQLHGEEALAVPGTVALASGKNAELQAVRVGEHAYGLQFHAEVVGEMLAVFAAQDEMLSDCSREELQMQYAQHAEELNDIAVQIFTNFLDIAGLISTVDVTEELDVRSADAVEKKRV